MPRPKREDGRNARTVANNKYKDKAYRRYELSIDRGYYSDILSPAVKRSGQSMRAYILDAIADRIKREQ